MSESKKIRYYFAGIFLGIAFLLAMNYLGCINKVMCFFDFDLGAFLFLPVIIFVFGVVGFIFLVLALMAKAELK